MKSESTFLIVLIALLCRLSLTLEVQMVDASETIYIRGNGSVDPSTAPIQVDGDIYTLTGDIVVSNVDGIVIQRNNTILDGDHHSVQFAESTSVVHAGIFLNNSLENVTIKNTNLIGFNRGVVFFSVHACNFYGNKIADSVDAALYVWSCDSVGIFNNSITDCNDAILLLYSSYNNNASFNIITNDGEGIGLLYNCYNNTISNNNVTHNGLGIILDSSYDNIFYGNDIANNNYGFYLGGGSSDNKFYHNNIANSAYQVWQTDSANTWDMGYPSGGNYWSDYNGTDANQDGIGDTPYIIDVNNTDHYPLMAQYVIPEFPSLIILPSFMLVALLAGACRRRMRH